MDTKNSALPPKEATRCAVYARTASCFERARDSAADEQIALCKDTAHKRGWTVVEDCVRADVGISGNTMVGRRGLSELLALAGTRPRPFDMLICESTDRLARNLSITVPILDALTNNGVTVHFVAQNLGTADPHFREIFCLRGQVDWPFLLSHGAGIRRGIQRSKLAKAKKTASAVATA